MNAYFQKGDEVLTYKASKTWTCEELNHMAREGWSLLSPDSDEATMAQALAKVHGPCDDLVEAMDDLNKIGEDWYQNQDFQRG